jgi:nicotinamide mononucleotide transporter
VLSVWLTARQHISCWPIGLVNVTLSGIVFVEAKLYADAGLQAVYFVLCAYGWWAWLHGGEGHGPLVVERAPRRMLALGGLAGVAGLFALGAFFSTATDAALPWLDSTLTAFSLVAQWLMTRKWIENWAVWICVDVAYVGMYELKLLHGMALLYALFLVLCVIGRRSWAASLARPQAIA